MMEEEWGPWIEHDGKGRPVQEGVIVHRVYANGSEWCAPIGTTRVAPASYHGERFVTSWDWSRPGISVPVIRYRIRRPKALRELIDMVENLPVNAKEDA
jgi:hypothetical protein